MDNTRRFDGKGRIYEESRQGYSISAVELLQEHCLVGKTKVIADIGAGTGKLTELLLGIADKVYAVEPNADMRQVAVEKLGEYVGFLSVCGSAENTTLEKDSVDLVTVAQAFHWFDSNLFRVECRRILRPDGYVAIVYNEKIADSPIVRDMNIINRKICPLFKGNSGGIVIEKIQSFFVSDYRVYKCSNDAVYDKASFIGRALSSSYAPAKADDNYATYISAMSKLFDRYQSSGKVVIPTNTAVYIGKV